MIHTVLGSRRSPIPQRPRTRMDKCCHPHRIRFRSNYILPDMGRCTPTFFQIVISDTGSGVPRRPYHRPHLWLHPHTMSSLKHICIGHKISSTWTSTLDGLASTSRPTDKCDRRHTDRRSNTYRISDPRQTSRHTWPGMS